MSSASRAGASLSKTGRLGMVPPASNPAIALWVIPAAAASRSELRGVVRLPVAGFVQPASLVHRRSQHWMLHASL